jgi:mannose/fructose/N-acetylgalactosamine-specific phosphotransferase system component IIB
VCDGNFLTEVLILRVDDRLIHGQVIAGWARPLGIQFIVLASNTICEDEWACNAYQLAVPEGIRFVCVNLNECVHTCRDQNAKRIMIIVETVQDARILIEKGLSAREVNIGGLSFHEGAREIAPYIYLSPRDIEAVVRLYNMGIKVIGKQLPNSSAINVVKNLAGVIGD